MLGDNGAGKSTLHQDPLRRAPARRGRAARRRRGGAASGRRATPASAGIATVFQDLATVPLMSVWRNFFLGSEPTVGKGPLRRIDVKFAQETMREEMRKMGIDVRDPDQPVGTLSGGERQAVVDRARGLLRRQGADPRRADVGARGQAVGRRAALRRAGARARARRDLHHAQPAPRLPGRRPLRAAQPRQADGRLAARRDQPRRAGEDDVGRRRARPARRTSWSASWRPRGRSRSADGAAAARAHRRRRDRLRLARAGAHALARAHPDAVRRPRVRPARWSRARTRRRAPPTRRSPRSGSRAATPTGAG